MNGPLRSRQGCWTCRLRKKKCDEVRPCCNTCESLAITCYGYGPKPGWMQNVEERRAIIHSFREVVKSTSRRKTALRFARRGNQAIRPAPKSSPNDSIQSSSITPPSTAQPPFQSSQATPLDSGLGSSRGVSADTPQSLPARHSSESSSANVPTQDAILLMHFLDKVFPLQYPIYNPDISEGGRGWLLALLLQAKSFYHAALAVSAYHRRTIGAETMSPASQTTSLNQQEGHLEVCMKVVYHSAKEDCPALKIGTAAAIVQLLFFELFSGPGNTWRAHLDVLLSMYRQQHTMGLVDFGLSEHSRIALLEGRPIPENESVDTEIVTSFRFLGGTMVWLDIISSITTGVEPYLLAFHPSILALGSATQFEKIMGCKNSAVAHIGNISTLYAQKEQALRQGRFDSIHFEQAISRISLEIHLGMTQEGLKGFGISECDAAIVFNAMSDPSAFITSIFAHMASVYLHLVTQGFQNLEVLAMHVSGIIKMLQTSDSPEVLRAVVCPLYVIGTVAQPNEQIFFRDIFSSPPLLDAALKHRQRILPILEEVWRRRRQTVNLTWKDCLDLTSSILLL